MNKYIALDTETGGLDKDTSLLSAYFAVFTMDDEFKILNSLDLKIKHTVYNVTPKALEVNKINLIRHDEEAEFKSTAGQKLLSLLRSETQEGAIKLIPIGHGVAFDLQKIWIQLLGRKTWEHFVSYRTIDTGVIARFLQLKRLIPDDLSCSLGSLVEYFNVPVVGELHTAKSDTLATIDVFLKELDFEKRTLHIG